MTQGTVRASLVLMLVASLTACVGAEPDSGVRALGDNGNGMDNGNDNNA